MLWQRLTPELQAVLAASAALGLTINHSTFLCTRVNEPLLTSVAGNLKNVVMVRPLRLHASLILSDVPSIFPSSARIECSMYKYIESPRFNIEPCKMQCSALGARK